VTDEVGDLVAEVVQDRFEGGSVAVNVGEDGDSHGFRSLEFNVL
jgi:hypothetical protein